MLPYFTLSTTNKVSLNRDFEKKEDIRSDIINLFLFQLKCH